MRVFYLKSTALNENSYECPPLKGFNPKKPPEGCQKKANPLISLAFCWVFSLQTRILREKTKFSKQDYAKSYKLLVKLFPKASALAESWRALLKSEFSGGLLFKGNLQCLPPSRRSSDAKIKMQTFWKVVFRVKPSTNWLPEECTLGIWLYLRERAFFD